MTPAASCSPYISEPLPASIAIPSKPPLSNGSKALLLSSSMANKEIIPYGFDLNKKPDALALSVVPPTITPICSSQSYFTRTIHHLVIAPPPPRPLLEGKPHQQEPRLATQKLIKVTKEINLLPPKGHEVLTVVNTNKFRDVTCAKYQSVTRTTIDGVRLCWIRSKLFPLRRRRGRRHQLS